MNDEIEKALKLAKEKMPSFDTLIDLYDMTFVYITKEAANVSGYEPEEMIGKQISNFMTIPSDATSFRETIMKSMVGGSVKIPVKTKDGKERIVEMKHTTIELEGHPFLVTKAVPQKETN